MSYTKLFTGAAISEAYQKFRPTYPIVVVQRIISFLKYKKAGPYNLAVDVGCGSGQSTRVLSAHFNSVIGCDVSETQIKAANGKEKLQNVEYRVNSEETIPAENNSVDLITAAQAAHWFNLKTFYSEADRVLKPGGCLAIYGYGLAQIHQNPEGTELQRVFDEFYYGTLKGCWEDGRKHVEDLYVDIKLPYSDTERDDSLFIEMKYTLPDFVGYLSSWSAYHKYRKLNPQDSCVLQRVLEKFLNVYGVDEKSAGLIALSVKYPVFLLLSRKPGES